MSKIDGVLGIDISKATFDVALLIGEKRRKSKKFSNTLDGFEKLTEWLNRQRVERVHACLEATNIYGHPLATYLHQKGHAVSIVNSSQIKGYGQSQLRRTKNDRADATLIANFCKSLSPKPWKPPATEVAEGVSHFRKYTLGRALNPYFFVRHQDVSAKVGCSRCGTPSIDPSVRCAGPHDYSGEESFGDSPEDYPGRY